MTSNPPDGQVPGTASAVCKRPGCGNPLPARDRGRARQFCGAECARRYHNDARISAPAATAADTPADPLAALEGVIRQAAVLIRAARQQAAGLDPARVRAQVAEAEAARAPQAKTDARAETDRGRADAARERDALGNQHQAQMEAVAALTAAERARAERAEQLLEAERADRRHLTSALTAPASPANGNGNGNGNGR